VTDGNATDGLPQIPEGWTWRRVDDLAARIDRAITDGPFGSNLKTAHYTDSGPRVIRLQNIGDGEFLDAEAHISQAHFERLRAHEAKAGDIVVASLGETLPRACVVPDDLGPAIVKADCPRIRVGDEVRAEFLCAALNSPPVREQAATLIAGIGRPRLNLGKLKELRIPTPPLAEQDRIVAAIEQAMRSIADGEESLGEVARLADAFDAAVLHSVFGGAASDRGESELVLLGDLCERVGGRIQTGPFGSQLHASDYRDSGTPVVMPKNLDYGVVSADGIARV